MEKSNEQTMWVQSNQNWITCKLRIKLREDGSQIFGLSILPTDDRFQEEDRGKTFLEIKTDVNGATSISLPGTNFQLNDVQRAALVCLLIESNNRLGLGTEYETLKTRKNRKNS